MSKTGVNCALSAATFNRTIEELKYKKHHNEKQLEKTFNRTIEELKSYSVSLIPLGLVPFNRTIEELKYWSNFNI